MKSKLTVEMDEEVLVRLRVVAAQERKKISEIIRGLVDSYLRAKESR